MDPLPLSAWLFRLFENQLTNKLSILGLLVWGYVSVRPFVIQRASFAPHIRIINEKDSFKRQIKTHLNIRFPLQVLNEDGSVVDQ